MARKRCIRTRRIFDLNNVGSQDVYEIGAFIYGCLFSINGDPLDLQLRTWNADWPAVARCLIELNPGSTFH